MENKELETWLKETKAKNLSLEELKNIIRTDSKKELIIKIRNKFNLVEGESLSECLFNQWQKEKEFSPKRGDRVLVYNNGRDEENRIFVAKIENAVKPIIYVLPMDEQKFLNNEQFRVTNRDFMKPLPTELPTETDFKSKAIELIQIEINLLKSQIDSAAKDKLYQRASNLEYELCGTSKILNKIKQL
jgi:hypothetical protein